MFCSLPLKDDIARAVPTSAWGPKRARPISSDFEFGGPGIVNMEANELETTWIVTNTKWKVLGILQRRRRIFGGSWSCTLYFYVSE